MLEWIAAHPEACVVVGTWIVQGVAVIWGLRVSVGRLTDAIEALRIELRRLHQRQDGTDDVQRIHGERIGWLEGSHGRFEAHMRRQAESGL